MLMINSNTQCQQMSVQSNKQVNRGRQILMELNLKRERILNAIVQPKSSRALGKGLMLLVGGFAGFQYLRCEWYRKDRGEVIRRIRAEERAEGDFKFDYKFTDQKQWEGKRFWIETKLGNERFFVRRRKNGKDGYMVFAPMIVAQNNGIQEGNIDFVTRSIYHRTIYALNMGWIAGINKPNLKLTMYPQRYIEQNDEEDALKARLHQFYDGISRQEMIFRMEVIVRKPQERNFFLSRYNNEQKPYFRWADLQLLRRLFRATNESAFESIYLERIWDDNHQWTPDEKNAFEAGTKQTITNDIQTQFEDFKLKRVLETAVIATGSLFTYFVL